jgi:hypothetical protein
VLFARLDEAREGTDDQAGDEESDHGHRLYVVVGGGKRFDACP